jgi:hypothetical protein
VKSIATPENLNRINGTFALLILLACPQEFVSKQQRNGTTKYTEVIVLAFRIISSQNKDMKQKEQYPPAVLQYKARHKVHQRQIQVHEP